MPMPTWLSNHLQAQGLMDDAGNTRRARHRHCTRCRADILTGFDGDLVARTVTVDPTPLSARGEAQALLTGRYTVELRWAAGRLELDRRDHWQIQGRPAGGEHNRCDVLAEHRCGTPPLDASPTRLNHSPPTTIDDQPPF